MAENGTFHCDVLVIGSGASGMAAAITAAHRGLKVLILEKEAKFGGTTARSGGWLWIPNTSLAQALGYREDAEAARTYLQQETGACFDAERVDAYLENGPKAVEFFTSNTAVRFDMPLVFPDYHAEMLGGVQGGRAMIARPFDARHLGERIGELGGPLPELTIFGMMLGSGKDIIHFMRVTRSWESLVYVAERLARHAFEVIKYDRGLLLTNGNALAGRLAKSAFDVGVSLWLSSSARELILDHGHVRGAWVERSGEQWKVLARRAVVLACGGFPHDIARRKALFPHAPTGAEHWSPAPSGNTGDGLRMAEALGAQVDTRMPHAAAWVPVSRVKRKDGGEGVMPHFIDRAKPGVIAVTREGKRFTNEANSYHDFVLAMVDACRGKDEIASFLLCDHRTLRRYGLGCVAPFPIPIGRHLRTGYLLRCRTLSALAQSAGIEANALAATVSEYNIHAREGKDPVFGKGSKAYNRFQGDVLHSPNPCVAPLEKPPFYAIKVVIGDLGTFAGLVTDRHARVLDSHRVPIAGLYAVGNDMASIMGGNYPAGGITLGPALTFGYIAGNHIADGERRDRELGEETLDTIDSIIPRP